MTISQIRSPELFQRLVRKLFVAELGKDYQVVDDSGGDGGLDGYDRSKKHLHAYYCPEKPESARYRDKFRGDIGKACVLRDSNAYDISVFVFITPSPMREPLQRDLRNSAIESGFTDGINIADEYLETLFRKHPQLRDEFPELNYPRVEAKLEEIQETLARIADDKMGPAEATEKCSKRKEISGKELKIWLFADLYDQKVHEMQARLYGGNQTAIAELTAYRARTEEPQIALLIMNILADYFLMKGDFEASEAVSREAVHLAEVNQLSSYEAYFRSTIARSLSHKSSQIDLLSVHRINMTNLTGISFETAEGKRQTVEGMRKLQEEADQEMASAIRLAGESYNLEALWQVLNNFAWKEIVLAYPHFTINNMRPVEKALRIARSVFERLFTIAPYFGQEMLIRTFLSYSGILGLMAKFSEASGFLQQAVAIAEKEGNEELLTQARKLQKDIEEIMDRGSRRGR